MNIIEVINSLPKMKAFTPATETQIVDAELRLRVKFADEYREYLATFGAIIADGIELSGIAKAAYRNVADLTEAEWELNPYVPHTMYVVENTHVDGIIIWQKTDGKIFETRARSKPQEIANSLAEYISNHA